jgi:ubiquinone/menaquinone biosynthesis C-methylase UbiE
MIYRKFGVALLLMFCCAIASAQQPQGQSRGTRSSDEYIKLLESERRLEGLQVIKVIETLKVKPGDHVADIGSGSGVFTRPLAQKVGAKGVVYAVDIDPELIKYVEKTAAEQKLTNIKTLLAAEADPKLPAPVDLIVIIDTMHHIANQPTYVKGLKKYLKPNGRVAIIDFSKNWPAGHEKMIYTVVDLDGWMKAAGFKRTEQHDFLENNFFVVYQ